MMNRFLNHLNFVNLKLIDTWTDKDTLNKVR